MTWMSPATDSFEFDLLDSDFCLALKNSTISDPETAAEPLTTGSKLDWTGSGLVLS